MGHQASENLLTLTSCSRLVVSLLLFIIDWSLAMRHKLSSQNDLKDFAY